MYLGQWKRDLCGAEQQQEKTILYNSFIILIILTTKENVQTDVSN